WEQALQLASEATSWGRQPDAFTRTSLVNALGRAGLWDQSLAILQRMQTQNSEIQAVTLNAAVSSMERSDQWTWCLQLLAASRSLRSQPGLSSLSSAISACAAPGRWQDALALLRQIKDSAILPDVVAFSAAITACERCQQWIWALDTWAMLRLQGLQPDVLTHGVAISACTAGAHWESSLNLWSDLRNRSGLRPSAISYSAAISAVGAGSFWDAAIALLWEMRAYALQTSVVSYRITDAYGKIVICKKQTVPLAAEASRPRAALQLDTYISIAISAAAVRGAFWVSIALGLVSGSCPCLAAPSGAAFMASPCEQNPMQDSDSYRFPSWVHETCQLINFTHARAASGDALPARGAERPKPRVVISFNSAISALEKCAEWQMALASLQRLVHHGLEPTDVTFGAALSSCEKGLQWQRVAALAKAMSEAALICTHVPDCDRIACMDTMPSCPRDCNGSASCAPNEIGSFTWLRRTRFGITSRFDGSVMKCTALRTAESPRSRSSEVWMLDVSAQSEPGGPEFRKLGWSGPVPWPLLVHCIDVCIPCLCCQAEGSGPPVSSMSSRKADQMFAPRMPDEGLDIPDHLGSDVTFDQKKRLARLAKMGIGPVAGAGGRAPSSSGSNASRGGGALALTDQRSVDGRGDASAAGLTDEERQGRLAERRFAMIEQERRLRMQEEQKRQQEEDDAKDRFRKSTRNRAGLVSLGAVQARPESLGRFPTPASAPVASVFESGPPMQKKGKMEVKISARTVESVAAARVVEAPAALPKVKESRSSDGDDKQESARRFQESVPRSAAPPAAAAAAPEPEDSEDDEPPASPVRAAPAAPGLSAEAQVLAELRAQRRQAEAREARRQAEAEGKKKGKKRKKTKKKDDSECEGSEEDMASEDSGEQESRDRLATVQARKQSRDGGISWKVMEGAGQSVKGMVSSDNKRMTDAELERRFAAQDNQSGSHGLMSEEQVKKMLQKEKISKGDVNSSWRAQKELEEWTKMKEQKMSRAGNDKERLVVSRK
ncbi:unnamed protein product, partial [Polarella glacialis]